MIKKKLAAAQDPTPVDNHTLTGLVEYLKCCRKDQFSLLDIVERMSQLQISEAEITSLLNYSPEHYTRNLFFKNDIFEILVMCWSGGQQSPIHDHAQSYSVEYIYTGRILNSLYHQTTADDDEVYQGASEMVQPGQIIYSTPGEIHRIANPDATPAASIHLYWPPLTHIRCFNEPGSAAQLITLGYFSN